MKIIQLKEQLAEGTPLPQTDAASILPHIEDGGRVVFTARRKCEEAVCLELRSEAANVIAHGSYFVGLDWIKEKELAVQVCPKMNDSIEIDYVRMLNDALLEQENAKHLDGLLTIKFDKPSIRVSQQHDVLSIFLITEYLNLLYQIVRKGLKRSFYSVEENLSNKVKGKILVGKNICMNLTKGKLTDNFCHFQVYGIDSTENRILKKALRFCIKQLKVYGLAANAYALRKKVRLISPYFNNVGEDISIQAIKGYNGNPVFKEYHQAIQIAQLLLRRYSYNITSVGKQEVPTPPFWIDMSKLFELYVFHHLRHVFTAREIDYHVHAHYQELDYLLNPKEWAEPYIIDAKYKPQYKKSGISKDDAREVAGYARLSSIYGKLGLDEDKALPIKCLIVYPDQDEEEAFQFNRNREPLFEKISGYARMYKVGIRLPVIESSTAASDDSVK